jgi:hypothetical protein
VNKVLDDVLDEYITVQQARDQYGVAIDPRTLKINAEETERLRASMAAGNGAN